MMKINSRRFRISPNLFKLSPCKKFISVHKANYSGTEIEKWWLESEGVKLSSSSISKDYYNFTLPEDVNILELFDERYYPQLMDGFSPNWNKELHLGHMSNFCIAKALKCLLGVHPIYTVNQVEGMKPEFEQKIADFMKEFDYSPLHIYPTTSLPAYKTFVPAELLDGEGDFSDTKYIEINGVKKVCFKADGTTTYFMEDMLVLGILNQPVLYVTGKEQQEHFGVLSDYAKEHFPSLNIDSEMVTHIPCGHVTIGGSKMSTRTGKIVLAEHLVEEVAEMFEGNRKLAYNIIACQILWSSFETDKILDFDKLSNPKTSVGLYLSYTLARLHSAGVVLSSDYVSPITQFVTHQSRFNCTAHHLLRHLRDLAEVINKDYDNKKEFDISSGDKNIVEHFDKLGSELLSGMKLLGLYQIEKV